MVELRKTILSVAAIFVVAASAHAGLSPVCVVDGASDAAYTLDLAQCQEVLLFGFSDRGPVAADVVPHSERLAETAPGEEAEPAITLRDGRSSLDFCLYTLLGLGVFRSGHWVRRTSLGFIPEWYHSGAPQQIGHSHAVGPDAYCHAAVCFVQPDVMPDRLMPLYDRGTIPSLVRTSQFISDVLASRAPPSLS